MPRSFFFLSLESHLPLGARILSPPVTDLVANPHPRRPSSSPVPILVGRPRPPPSSLEFCSTSLLASCVLPSVPAPDTIIAAPRRSWFQHLSAAAGGGQYHPLLAGCSSKTRPGQLQVLPMLVPALQPLLPTKQIPQITDSPSNLIIAKETAGSSNKLLRFQQKSHKHQNLTNSPTNLIVAKETAGFSNKLLWFQQNSHKS